MVAYNLIFTVYFIKSLLMPQFNHFSFYGYLVWSKITLFLEMTLIFVFVICSYIKIFSDFFWERIRWELVSVYRSTVTFFFISSVHLSYACNIKQFEDRCGLRVTTQTVTIIFPQRNGTHIWLVFLHIQIRLLALIQDGIPAQKENLIYFN